jgi:hypothetical protein
MEKRKRDNGGEKRMENVEKEYLYHLFIIVILDYLMMAQQLYDRGLVEDVDYVSV